MKLNLPLLALGLSLLFAGVSQAAPVTLVNPSFEADVLNPEGASPSITGWGQSGAPWESYVYRPATPLTGIDANNEVGFQNYTGDSPYFYQVVNDPSLFGNTNYTSFTLTASLAGPTSGSVTIGLWNIRSWTFDGQLVTTTVTNLSPTHFQDFSVTLPAANVSASDIFDIFFSGLPDPVGSDYHTVSIDHVRLEANPNPVAGPPSITQQPVSSTNGVGEAINFSVSATGSALSYQWYLNATALPGATTSTLTLTNVQWTDAGSYAVVVSNGSGAVTSSNAVLTVVTINYDVAGDFSTNANPNGSWSYGYSTTLGGALTLYTDFGLDASDSLNYWRFDSGGIPGVYYNSNDTEQGPSSVRLAPHQLTFHPGASGQYSVIRFTVPTSGQYSLNAVFSGMDQSGTTTDVHILTNGTSCFDGTISGFGALSTNSTVLTLTQGETVDFVVGAGGNGYYYDSTGIAAQLACLSLILQPPSITQQPGNVTTAIGGTASFSVSATGTAPLSYQWYLNATPLAGANSATLNLTNVALAAAGNYSVVVTNRAGSVTSANATLAVGSASYDLATDFSTNTNPNGNWSYGYSTSLGGAMTLYTDFGFDTSDSLNYWRFNSSGIPGVYYNSTDAVQGPTSLRLAPHQLIFHPGASGQYSVIRFTAPASGQYALKAKFSGMDQTGPTTDVHVLKNGTSIFDGNISGFGALASTNGVLTLTQGETVDFVVGAGGNGYYYDSTGIAAELILLTIQPTITRQPAAVTAVAGSNATFSVGTAGAGPLNYQWYVNATLLPGANAATLTLTNVQWSDVGSYWVVVYNVYGYAISSTAPLNVGVTNYNLSSAFSTNANPNGSWSYGYSPTLGGTMTLYTDFGFDTSDSLNYWRYDSGGISGVYFNATDTVQGPSSVRLAPKQVMFHPGSSGQYSVIRFTVPASGQYAINALFSGMDQTGTTTDVHVLTNGVSIYDGNISGFGALATNSTILTLTQGEAVDFVVGAGGNGYYYDSTGIAAELISLTPEPKITRQPVGATILAGNAVTLSVGAAGAGPLSYQWYFNSNPLPGATSATLTLANPQWLDSGTYSVLVQNSFGSVASANATLAVGSADYNLTSAFSTNTNPNGNWSFGYSPTLGGAVTLYTDSGVDTSDSLNYWRFDSGGIPGVYYNTNDTVQGPASVRLAPNQVTFHPGPSGQYSVIRFTVPASGPYALSAVFSGMDQTGTTTDVHVLTNGVSTYDGTIAGFGALATDKTVLTLTQGETVDFVVGAGGNGYYYDSTGIAADLICLAPPATIAIPVANHSFESVTLDPDGVNVQIAGWVQDSAPFESFIYRPIVPQSGINDTNEVVFWNYSGDTPKLYQQVAVSPIYGNPNVKSYTLTVAVAGAATESVRVALWNWGHPVGDTWEYKWATSVQAGNLSADRFKDYSVTVPASQVVAGDSLVVLFFGLGNPIPGNNHTVLLDNVRLQANMGSTNDVSPAATSGIPAWWCAQYGLNPDDTNMPAADPDGDTLSNAEEYHCGLDPYDSNTVTDALTLNGAAGVASLGAWTTNGDNLDAVDRRGQVDYTFNVTVGDEYRLQVEGTQNGPVGTGPFNLRLSVDGQFVARRTLTAAYGVSGFVHCFTPFLPPGVHTVSIFWDNAANRTSLRIKTVKLQSIAGPDTNGNGIKDWVEAELARDNTIATNTASFTSPACVEGTASFPGLTVVSCSPDGNATNFPVRFGPDNGWFANTLLSTSGPTALTVAFESASLVVTQQVTWVSRNLLDGGSISIRQGDSLLLTAQPASGSATGTLVISVGTNQVSTPAGQPLPYQFDQTGVYTVIGTVNDQNGVPQTGSLSVQVVSYTFPFIPACVANQSRYWTLTNVPPVTVFGADARILFEQTATLTNNGRQMKLMIDDNDPRVVLARLGTNGPVLSAVSLAGTRVYTDDQTYLQLVATYPDGTRVVETVVVADNLPPGAFIELDIFVGGVTFEDGTTVKRLTAADFDSLGQCKVRFLWPAGSITSVCHTVTVYQGDDTVGTRNH
jgi:hypothetical protein